MELLDSDIYEVYDQHQREKSTGSGLVLAVPAMVLETSSDDIDPSKPMVVTTGEYENLVTDNQYYEQVEFGKHRGEQRLGDGVHDDSLYSIPQVISTSSSTGLTSSIVKGLSLQSVGRRLSSVRKTLTRIKRHSRAVEPGQHGRPETSSTMVKSLEDMYSKPNKFSLPVLPDTNNPSLVIVTKKTMSMVRTSAEEDSKSYMSVRVQADKNSDAQYDCTCDAHRCKKYSVMLGLVSCLVSLLTVGLYFMSDNVVTVIPENVNIVNNRRNFIYQPSPDIARLDRSTTWKDFNQINWGTAPAPTRSLSTSSSSPPSSRSSRSTSSWTSWSSWSQCSSNPCIKGETIARSRRCVDTRTGVDSDMKQCIKQGGVNVEMEPCFCFR